MGLMVAGDFVTSTRTLIYTFCMLVRLVHVYKSKTTNKTKFHHAILIADRSEVGRRPVADLSQTCQLAASELDRA